MDRTELKQELSDILESVRMRLNREAEDEVRSWLMAATLKIWSGNGLCAEEYAPALTVFYDRHYTTAQIMTALDCVGEDVRALDVPRFFRDLVSEDAKDGTSISRTVADDLCRFLANMAMVNGDFTLAEAGVLRKISDLLLDHCRSMCIAPGKGPEIHPEMITELSRIGYYQKLPEKEEKPEEAPKPEPKPEPAAPAAAPVINVLLNVNAAPENKPVTDLRQPEIPAENETGVTVTKPADKASSEETLESVLAQLHGLVGLDKVKEDVQSLINFIKICQLRTTRGMKVPTVSYHLVFTGNPGTGKTTVARMVARLYYLMGILPQGQLVETDRSGLVAGYLGQTAIKTQKVIQEALGGVLFIDEAYALANDKEDSYGKEAIETILKAMEDHRDELVVIVAGYDELMHQFIDSNPGLRSRFNKYFRFPDYTSGELLKILQTFCENNGYVLSEEAIPYLKIKLEDMYKQRQEHFGNARAIRNVFERAINNQANRLVLDNDITDAELMELSLRDMMWAVEGN